MGSALAVLSRDLSRFLLIPAGMALLSLVVCVVSGEWFAIAPFLITLSSVAGLSGLLNYFGRSATERFSQRQTLISVAVGWALVCAVGALPIWLTAMFVGAEATPTVAYFTNGLNALFEGFSGFTSAGLTMVIRPSQLPVSLQWWRSFMQWVGGVGVIVLTVALLEPAQDQYVLYQAEGRQQRLRLTMTRTVRRIWTIYAGYTAVAILLFRLAGMTWWEAVNHSMSAISTGGFSITDGNMSSYGTAVKVVVMLVMLCGAISFSVHDQLITKFRLTILLRDRQHFLLLGLLIVGAGVIGLEHYTFTGRFAWTDSIFQWVSALTTCGFSTQPIQFWSTTNKLLLGIAMVLGGAAGSTVGGLKLSRVLSLLESLAWRFRRTTLLPHQMVVRFIDGEPLAPAQASRQIEDAAALGLLWILVVTLGTLLLLRVVPLEYGLSDVMFEVSSALGSAGLSTGIAGPSLHWSGKCLLMLLMWMGRLEIVPVLALLSAVGGVFPKRVR